MDDKKKVVAAMTAVISYIQEEEAVVHAQATAAAKASQVPHAVPVNLWSASGRQSMMQMRNLMQLRTFNRI